MLSLPTRRGRSSSIVLHRVPALIGHGLWMQNKPTRPGIHLDARKQTSHTPSGIETLRQRPFMFALLAAALVLHIQPCLAACGGNGDPVCTGAELLGAPQLL